jgi:rhodanese-related sulfurtransferase
MNRNIRLAAALLAGAALSVPALGKDISATEANAGQQAGKLRLIDIRRPDEWRQTGIAKGAARVNMIQPGGAQGFLDALLKETGGSKDAPIALICRTGNRTTQVEKFLEAQGFTHVYNVKEGMAGSGAGPGWIKRGLPVEDCSRC